MGNGLYDKGRNRFARGEIAWKVGGDTIRAFLVDSAQYTVDLVNHEFLTDLPGAARKGHSGNTGRTDAPALTLIDPAAGVVDANNLIFSAVTAGTSFEAIVIFKDSGADATSPLIAYIDTGTGLPVTSNGADITIAWDDGANKIFKL